MARILLVEDDEAMAQMIRDILDSGGHDVQHAFDGIYALQFLGMEPPDEFKDDKSGKDWMNINNQWTTDKSPKAIPELLVVDCMMPRMDGLTLVTQMSNTDVIKDIPVIILTTKSKMKDPFQAVSNVKGFVAKPADPDILLMEITNVLAKGGA